MIKTCRHSGPGSLTFQSRSLLVDESAELVHVAVVRKNGADGQVSVRWRTIDGTAISGKDYHGGEGVLIFRNAEVMN